MKILHECKVLVYKYDSIDELTEHRADMIVDGWHVDFDDEEDLVAEYTKSPDDL